MAVAVSRAPCEGGILLLLLGLGSVSALGSASGDCLRWNEDSRGGLAFLYDGVGIALYSTRAWAEMLALGTKRVPKLVEMSLSLRPRYFWSLDLFIDSEWSPTARRVADVVYW